VDILPLPDRLVLREILPPLSVGLLAVVQLLVLGQLLQLNEVVFGAAVTLRDLATFTLALIPHFMALAMPLTFVLGVQLGLGRLHGDRELLALASAGRSPLQLYRVPAVLALLLGLCSAWLVRTAEPWGLAALRTSLDDVIRRNLRSGLLTGVFNDGLPRLTIYLEERLGTSAAPGWRHLLVEDRSGKEPLLALADEGRLTDDGADAFSLQLSAGELFRPEEHGELRARFDTASIDVDLRTLLLVKNKMGTSEAALSAEELESQAQAREAQHDVRLAGRARLEQARRRTAPLSCLSFLLLAVPLALVSGGARGAAYITTLLSFAAFFVLQRAGQAWAEAGGPALWAGLLPGLVLVAVGLVLSARLVMRGVGSVR
jgi:lipopolysaccharide export system permease protein